MAKSRTSIQLLRKTAEKLRFIAKRSTIGDNEKAFYAELFKQVAEGHYNDVIPDKNTVPPVRFPLDGEVMNKIKEVSESKGYTRHPQEFMSKVISYEWNLLKKEGTVSFMKQYYSPEDDEKSEK